MARYVITRPWFGVEEGQIMTSDSLHPALKSHVRELIEEETHRLTEPETGEDLTETEPETGDGGAPDTEPEADEDTPPKGRRGRKAKS